MSAERTGLGWEAVYDRNGVFIGLNYPERGGAEPARHPHKVEDAGSTPARATTPPGRCGDPWPHGRHKWVTGPEYGSQVYECPGWTMFERGLAVVAHMEPDFRRCDAERVRLARLRSYQQTPPVRLGGAGR